MVRLASVQHNGKTKLAAQLPESSGYVDLTSIAPNARDFFLLGNAGIDRAKTLIQECSHPSSELFMASDAVSLLAPIDGSLVGKFL